MITFKKTDHSLLKEWRENYFSEIRLSQELFIEWMVAEGTCFTITNNSDKIGYSILSKDNTLVEFYLPPKALNEKDDIFQQIITQHNITKAYCKSFDHILLACCHVLCKQSNTIGVLYRNYIKQTDVKLNNNINVRLAEAKDIPLLLSHNSELYSSPEELNFTVSNKMVHMFEKENQLVACGYLIKILPDKHYYDIGMWTNPDFRKQGYGTMVINYLKNYCLSHNFAPICGRDAQNTGSKKTLEQCGFYSKYSLIEFDF